MELSFLVDNQMRPASGYKPIKVWTDDSLPGRSDGYSQPVTANGRTAVAMEK